MPKICGIKRLMTRLSLLFSMRTSILKAFLSLLPARRYFVQTYSVKMDMLLVAIRGIINANANEQDTGCGFQIDTRLPLQITRLKIASNPFAKGFRDIPASKR